MVEHYLSSPAHRRGQGVHHTGVRPLIDEIPTDTISLIGSVADR